MVNEVTILRRDIWLTSIFSAFLKQSTFWRVRAIWDLWLVPTLNQNFLPNHLTFLLQCWVCVWLIDLLSTYKWSFIQKQMAKWWQLYTPPTHPVKHLQRVYSKTDFDTCTNVSKWIKILLEQVYLSHNLNCSAWLICSQSCILHFIYIFSRSQDICIVVRQLDIAGRCQPGGTMHLSGRMQRNN